MKITKQLREQLEKYLPKNYRVTIVERLKAKGIECHPNTVSNCLSGRTNNSEVALQLIKLSNEIKSEEENLHKEIAKNVKQLTTAGAAS